MGSGESSHLLIKWKHGEVIIVDSTKEGDDGKGDDDKDDARAALDQRAAAAASRQETAVPLPKADARIQQRDSRQKQYTALSRQLTLLRQSLDTAQQALKILTGNQSADLDTLIAKWRSVVRDTADELFEHAKQRLDSHGGVQTRLRRQVQEPADLWFDHLDHRQHGQLTDAQRRMLEMQRADDQAEAEKYGLTEKLPETEEAEASFTLDKMLLHMNCDPKLVGYDAEEQRWLD
ncbi:hypothetical protein DV737_g4990, partial [Chaetothyriales sp. CBS 132003]